MSMPKIPDINPNININRDDAVNIIITSIAMEELAISHILNAEGEKLQYVLGTLEGIDPGEITICDIMEVNNSIKKTLRDVIKAEMLLQLKLEDAVELANTTTECQLTIKGQKIWRDGNNVNDSRPPTVEVNLLRDGEVYKTVSVDSTGDGTYIFPCLPVWKDPMTQYTYKVDETTVPAGYTKTISGFNIINTIEPGSIPINGLKTWVDNDNIGNERPLEITVHLLQNGNLCNSIQVASPNAPNNEEPFIFPNMPQFDDEGNLFDYTVDEADITGYEKRIDGFHITNTLL